MMKEVKRMVDVSGYNLGFSEIRIRPSAEMIYPWQPKSHTREHPEWSGGPT